MAAFIIATILLILVLLYYFLTNGTPPSNSERWLSTYFYAHRGLHNAMDPENTIPAFKNALHYGFGVELDVHLSADGQVIVFHDDTLDRLTNQTGELSKKNASELTSLKILNTSYTIPLLSEVLEVINGQVPLLIEIKSIGFAGELEEKVYCLMKQYRGNFAIQSFSPFSIGWFKKNAPEILRGQLSSDFKNEAVSISFFKKYFVRKLWTNFLCRPHFISYEKKGVANGTVQRLRKKGVMALAWCVENNKEEIEVRAKTDSIIFEGYLPSIERRGEEND